MAPNPQPNVLNAARKMAAASLLLASFASVAVLHAQQFTKPTAQELAMTELAGHPGVPAVMLFKEEITRDDMHTVEHYRRIKILTKEGIDKYANVDIGYVSTYGVGDVNGDEKTVNSISARTIHPDGTIIPFTGKPYLKVLEQGKDYKAQSKIFTLPDVTVGSIIEYRYTTSIADHVFEAPSWMIQEDLFIKQAHYQWIPTRLELVDEDEQPINTITWFPVLPKGVEIAKEDQAIADANGSGSRRVFELKISDVPAKPVEDYMPPIAYYSYRVLFNFSSYRSGAEYWKAEGKHLTKHMAKWSEPNSDVAQITRTVIGDATTQDQKLRKIYAAVMKLENTAYTRERGDREQKATGGPVTNAADVYSHERGSPVQLTGLFVAMARAAGMKAYLMYVPDRGENLFTPQWLTTRQFDAMIAIVNVDGKEQFFDPGERYCPYGHLAWQHTFVSGLRQTEGGTDFGQTLGEGSSENRTTRVANLTMDKSGQMTGKLDVSFSGAPALRWRQLMLTGDEQSLKERLRTYMEDMVPKTLEVKVDTIANASDYELPLKVTYSVTGTMGTETGKRLVLPVDAFTSRSGATFPHEKRELSIYFHYPQTVQDALRVNLPPNWTVEAAPSEGKYNLEKLALYTINTTSTGTQFTTRRNYVFGDVIVPVASYPTLRTFYSQFEAKDQESVVLKPVALTASTDTKE